MREASTRPAPEADEHDPFAAGELASVVPTTGPQREVWLADKLGREASLAYNESVTLTLAGPLDAAALADALQALVARHDSLRATFSEDGRELHVAAEGAMPVEVLRHEGADAVARQRALQEVQRRAVLEPFDLARGPLVRATLVAFGPAEHALVLTLHHAVCDGWSFGVLAKELGALYAERTGGGTAPLPPAPRYADYAVAQAARAGEAEDEAYWLSLYKGSVPALDLPTDRPRAAQRAFESERIDVELDAALVEAVRKTAARNGASLFAALLAAFAGLLQRVGGGDDLVVGVPAAGQAASGNEGLVGHCVNMLPVRLAVRPEEPGTGLLGGVQRAMLDAFEHRQYTFGTLLEKLALARDPSRLPLVSVVFNVDQKVEGASLGFPGIAADLSSNPRAYENFEIFINAVHAGGALRLETQYNAKLFEAATIRRWLAAYEALLRALVADAARPLHALVPLPDEDRRLLATWNATDRAYERGLRLGELVARGMGEHAARPAVIFEGATITHAELEERAWALALALRAAGVTPGMPVGVCLERSVELVVALLGIVYSGGAYVPLDPGYPADRLARMCDDAALRVVVTRRAEAERVGAGLPVSAQRIHLDGEALPAAPAAARTFVGTPDDCAYVIFTSGSTGRPKGAMNAHAGIVNRIQWMQEAYALTPDDRVLQKTPYSFDVSVWEFFWPLMAGAAIVVARPEGHKDAAYLRDLIRGERVTVLHFVPSMLRAFLEVDGVEGCGGVRRVVCSGEGLPYDLVEAFFDKLPGVALANLYGPTEAAVDVTAWECRPHDPSGIVPIGVPIANTRIYILDERLQPVPIGTPGELYIAGIQVGMGYVSRPELTAERFLADPFAPGERMYRTGDVARWRNDGTIEHLGRADFQVKVRGFRIELGEIETTLCSHPAVAQAVVVAREARKGDLRLVGYYAARGPAPDEAALRAHLKATLPDYMVPAQLVALEAIPLLPNGKVDRKALPEPQAPAPSREYVAPRNDLERLVAAEMEAALGLPGVGIHEDFFMLGGHSLLAAQLTARLGRALKVDVSMRTLFAAPTIATLAAAIEAQRARPAAVRKPIGRLYDRARAPASLMQERLWFLEELNPGRVTYHAPSAHRLTGPMDAAAFQRAFDEMVRRQPALRTRLAAEGDVVVQHIEAHVATPLFPAEDLSALPPAERESTLMGRLATLTAKTFDLQRAPLFRAHLFRLGAEEHVLFFMPHHIVWDGWSFDLVYEEMAALYGAFVQGRPAPLPELPVSYGDFAAWQRDWLQGEEFAAQLEFWRKRIARAGAIEPLPTDKPRRPGMSGEGATEWIAVDRARVDALHALARRAGTTVFAVTLALYAVLLHAYAGQRRLVVGTPVRGRNAAELEPVMGYFNNLVPLHLEIEPAEAFEAFLARVKATVVESFSAPDVPMDLLASDLLASSGAGGAQLYHALFSFQDARKRPIRWGGLAHEPIQLFQKGATEDLGFWLMETGRGLHGGLTYNTDILEQATVRELHRAYGALVDAVTASGAVPIGVLAEGLGLAARMAATAPAPARPAAARSGTPPATATEKLLAEIWRGELKLAAVTLEDNFFDLGGHSLLAMQAILAMEGRTGKRIDRNRYIFETLQQIARAYDEAGAAPAARSGGLRGLLSGLMGGRK